MTSAQQLGATVIPWFVVPPLRIGPVALESFGILTAAGILLASRLLRSAARKRGLDPDPVERSLTWAIVGGILGAHWMHVFAYHPEDLRTGGALQLLKVWDGLSSTGGVIGGLAGVLLSFRRMHLTFWPYADAFALGVAPGWAVARLGCFSVHDHPGVHSTFLLAVNFADGPRHDLGLYDALALGVTTALLYAFDKRGLLRDQLLPLLGLLYGVSRFFLDFLRASDLPYSDARYAGLTPAQIASIALVLWGASRLLLRPGSPPRGAELR